MGINCINFYFIKSAYCFSWVSYSTYVIYRIFGTEEDGEERRGEQRGRQLKYTKT